VTEDPYNNDPSMGTLVAVVIGCMFAVALLLGVSCCTGANDNRVRTALDVLADTIDPAYAFAMDACAEREAREVDAVRSGGSTFARAESAIEDIRARCDRVRDAFDSMRKAHAEAVTLVDQGEVKQAAERVEDVRGMWRTLAGGVIP
jgi:hypothetical protein